MDNAFSSLFRQNWYVEHRTHTCELTPENVSNFVEKNSALPRDFVPCLDSAGLSFVCRFRSAAQFNEDFAPPQGAERTSSRLKGSEAWPFRAIALEVWACAAEGDGLAPAAVAEFKRAVTQVCPCYIHVRLATREAEVPPQWAEALRDAEAATRTLCMVVVEGFSEPAADASPFARPRQYYDLRGATRMLQAFCEVVPVGKEISYLVIRNARITTLKGVVQFASMVRLEDCEMAARTLLELKDDPRKPGEGNHNGPPRAFHDQVELVAWKGWPFPNPELGGSTDAEIEAVAEAVHWRGRLGYNNLFVLEDDSGHDEYGPGEEEEEEESTTLSGSSSDEENPKSEPKQENQGPPAEAKAQPYSDRPVSEWLRLEEALRARRASWGNSLFEMETDFYVSRKNHAWVFGDVFAFDEV